MAGLIPACFAKGDNKTAHRHFGAVLIKAPTLVQQVGGTLALTFLAELKHGLKLVAADLIGVFPHSPAAPTSSKNALEATRNTNTQTRQPLSLVFPHLKLYLNPQKPKYSHRRYLLSYGLRRTIAPTTIPRSLSLRRSPSSQIGAIIRLVRSSPPNFRSRPDRSPPFSFLRSARSIANRSDGGG